MNFVLKGLPAIDRDDGYFMVVETDQVRVGVDIDFGVIEVDALAGGGDHLFGIVAEAAAGAGIKCHLRFHLPVNILPFGIALARDQKVDQGDPRQEAADMGEEGNASALGSVGIADGAHTVKELDEEPPDQHKPGGDFDGGEEEDDGHQRNDTRMRELDHVGAHHAGDGAGGADHRHAGTRIAQELGHSGGGAAQQVKQQVLGGAQDVLDIVAEDPQEPHVAQHVQPTAVEEHGGEHAQKAEVDRKSTRLNSSHANISYAVFCLKK